MLLQVRTGLTTTHTSLWPSYFLLLLLLRLLVILLQPHTDPTPWSIAEPNNKSEGDNSIFTFGKPSPSRASV